MRNVEEGIQSLREIRMLEEICHLRPTHPHWESSEGVLFTNTLRNTFVKGAPASLKSSIAGLFCRPDLTGGATATRLENINAVGVIGFGVAGARWQHSTQGKMSVVTIMNSRVKAAIRIDGQVTPQKKQ